MKKLTLAALLLLTATSVYATDEWNEKSVASVVDQIRAGKEFTEQKSIPNQQVVQMNAFIRYYIDVKAKLCFVGSSSAPVPVSCKALKDGYPTMAPIISWEK
jgi:hypothetical protein